MTHRAKRSPSRTKTGMSLLEVIAVIAVVSILAGSVCLRSGYFLNRGKVQKTTREMSSIALASLSYIKNKGNCPQSTNDLAPDYTYAAITSSPFGGSYLIDCTNNKVSVSTTVPSGYINDDTRWGSLFQKETGVGTDKITITKRVSHEFDGRLFYDKKYVYRQ